MNQASEEQKLLLRVLRWKSEGISFANLSAETGFTTAAIERMISPFVDGGLLVRVAGDRLVSREALTAAIDLVHATLLARCSEGPTQE